MDYEIKQMNPVIATEAPPLMGRASSGKNIEIPDYLIYEVLDGIPVYYNGWKNELDKKQYSGKIRWYIDLRIILINLMKDYFQPIFDNQHLVMTGGVGLHISQKSHVPASRGSQ